MWRHCKKEISAMESDGMLNPVLFAPGVLTVISIVLIVGSIHFILVGSLAAPGGDNSKNPVFIQWSQIPLANTVCVAILWSFCFLLILADSSHYLLNLLIKFPPALITLKSLGLFSSLLEFIIKTSLLNCVLVWLLRRFAAKPL